MPTRRAFLLGTAGAAVAPVLTPTAAEAAAFLPYTADAFFRSRVDTAPVDAARTSAFRSFMATFTAQKKATWPKIQVSNDFAMTYHVGQASDPIWTLSGGSTNARLTITRTQGFHMADAVADSFPTGTQDRAGVMVDPVFGYSVVFSDAVPDRTTRTISVSSAGVFWHSSNGLDYRNPLTNDARNFSSRGRIPDAMVIRRDLLDEAIAAGTGLGHVLNLFFVETLTTDGFCHPMIGAESENFGFGAQGERIRIRPDLDLTTRGLTNAALAVSRTLQQHGGYLGDNSGSATKVKASQLSRYAGTNLATDCLRGKVFWNDFEVLPRGWPAV